MSRSSAFSSPLYEPFNSNPDLQLKPEHVSGVFSFFNPTVARFEYTPSSKVKPGTPESVASPDGVPAEKQQAHGGLEFKWRSRDNRKGRHTLVVDAHDPAAAKYKHMTGLRGIASGIGRMFTTFPVWDVSYIVAQTFTWGSVVFVINGFFYWLPLVAPGTEFPTEVGIGGGVTAFLGCCIFQLGAIAIMLEAMNENNTGCFGWALEEAVTEHEHLPGQMSRVVPSMDECLHHHSDKRCLVIKRDCGSYNGKPKASDASSNSSGKQHKPFRRTWVWLPTWQEVKTHYIHELGFVASFILLASATVFGIIGFTGLPGIYGGLSQGELYGLYWTPDIIGSVGFVISSYMYMLETQPNWYTPSFHVIGWHIGFWNTLGSIGFLISASVGTPSATCSACYYQSSLSTLWGSMCFLIGSVCLWYEAINKHPVEIKK